MSVQGAFMLQHLHFHTLQRQYDFPLQSYYTYK